MRCYNFCRFWRPLWTGAITAKKYQYQHLLKKSGQQLNITVRLQLVVVMSD